MTQQTHDDGAPEGVAGPLRTIDAPADSPVGGPVLVCPVHADLDADTAGLLAQVLAGAVAQAPAVLVVDLARVGFCDSTGLNALLRARLDCERDGIALRLAGAGPQVLRLLRIVGADELFDLRPDVEAAVPG